MTTKAVTGHTLIAWGFKPGPWFGPALERANAMWNDGRDDDEIRAVVADMQPDDPVPLRDEPGHWHEFVNPVSDDEHANVAAVRETMDAAMRTPDVVTGAVMPDACPAGPVGNIPVGGVIASPYIHPGMHSADVCCSLAASVVDASPAEAMERAWAVTHFGPGPRDHGPAADACKPYDLPEYDLGNPFLQGLAEPAVKYLATQGDGNHFLFVGTLASTGDTVVVTHHGSRAIGAEVYKRGVRAAQKHTREHAPDVGKACAWLSVDTDVGRDYWHALQAVRAWTRANHFAVHDLMGLAVRDRFWNEHNFVFRHDGLFYHAKGATPMWDRDYADDPLVDDRRLVPLNMTSPVLVLGARADADPDALGFAPHGAGRNMSRTQHRRRGTYDMAETEGYDIRWYRGRPDVGELPSAYKNAEHMHDDIEAMRLANVVDLILPYGCIMAGEGT